MNAQEQAQLFAQIQKMLFASEPARRRNIKELKQLLALYQENNPSIAFLLPLLDAVIAFRAKSAPGLFAKLRKATHRKGDEERTLQALTDVMTNAQEIKRQLEDRQPKSSKPNEQEKEVIELFDAVLSFSKLSVDARVGNLKRRKDPIFTAYDQETDKRNNISLKSKLSKIKILEKKVEEERYQIIDDVVATAQKQTGQKAQNIVTPPTNYDFMPAGNEYVAIPATSETNTIPDHYTALPVSIDDVAESPDANKKELDLVNSDIEYIGKPFSTGAYGVIQRCRYKGYDAAIKALCDGNGYFVIKRLKAGATPALQEDLRKEAQAGEQLYAHHANSQDYNLVRLGNINGEVVVVSRMEVFEFVDGKPVGKSADSYLESLATLPTNNTANIPHLSSSEISVAQIFSSMWTSVNAMHNAGVVHGDIALRNFLLKQTSFAGDEESLSQLQAVIMDYGFSRAIDEKGVVKSPYVGRNAPMRWLSQAAILGTPINALSDLYATKVSMLTAIGLMIGMKESEVVCLDPDNNKIFEFAVARAKISNPEALMIFYNNVAARLQQINNPALNRLLASYKDYIVNGFDERKFRSMSDQELKDTIEEQRVLDKAALHQANERFFVAEIAAILNDAATKPELETIRNAQRLTTLAFSAEFTESKGYQDFLKCQNVQQLSEVAFANWSKSQDVVSDNTATVSISEMDVITTTAHNRVGGHYEPLSIPSSGNYAGLPPSLDETENLDTSTSTVSTISPEDARELGYNPMPKTSEVANDTAYKLMPSNPGYVSLRDVEKEDNAVRERKAADLGKNYQQFSVVTGFHGAAPSDDFAYYPTSKPQPKVSQQDAMKQLKDIATGLENGLRFFHPVLSRLNFLEVGLTNGLKKLSGNFRDIISNGLSQVLVQYAAATDVNLQKEYQKVVRLLEMYIDAVAKKVDKLMKKVAVVDTVEEKKELIKLVNDIIPSRFVLAAMMPSSKVGEHAKQILETKIRLNEQTKYDNPHSIQGWYGLPEVKLQSNGKLDYEKFIASVKQSSAIVIELLESDNKSSGYSIIYPTPSSETALIVGKNRGDLKVVNVFRENPLDRTIPLENEMLALLRQALTHVPNSKDITASGNNAAAIAQCAEFTTASEKANVQSSVKLAAPSA